MAVKKFFKDYGELVKSTNRFYKEHTLDIVVLNAALIGATVGAAKATQKIKKIRAQKKLEKSIQDFIEK